MTQPKTANIYINPGVPDIDNRLWNWFFDMSLLETMEIVCSEYIQLYQESFFNKITILGMEPSGHLLPVTYHEGRLR